jgi:hypothetical protein
MQLGRQDAADKSYLPSSELKAYIPRRAGKDLGILLAKEGGVQAIFAYQEFVFKSFP